MGCLWVCLRVAAGFWVGAAGVENKTGTGSGEAVDVDTRRLDRLDRIW